MLDLKTLIKELNDLRILQRNQWGIKDIPEEYSKYFKNPLKRNLYLHKNEVYDLSISVFKFENIFIGVEHISNLKINLGGFKVCHCLKFFEMEEFNIISYKKKGGSNCL